MAPKRKVEVTAIDETDKALYPTFCNVANQLSQLYSRALNHQRLAFEAGQRHALEKLNEWIAMNQQEGITVTVADISSYLQNELNSGYHAGNAFHSRQNEVNTPFSTPSIRRHDGDENTSHSLNSDMDLDPEKSFH